MLPTPPFCNSQTAATAISRREPLELSIPLAPEEKLPAASSPVAVAGLVTIRLGRRGRFFSRRSSRLAAATSSFREAISGRLFKATGSSSSGERSEANEGHLQERRLDWLEQRGRVKQENLRQARTCDPPVADGDLLALPQALQFGLCPIDLQRCDQTGCQPLGEVDEQLGPDDRRPDAEQSSPRRLDVEIGLGHREQDIVPRGLEVGPPRGDHAPRRKRREDRVSEPDEQAGAAADEECLQPFPKIRTREDVLLNTIVPKVSDAPVESGDPEGLGLQLQSESLLNLCHGRGDIERPDPGELHRGREVDRQAFRHHSVHSAHGKPHPGRARDR